MVYKFALSEGKVRVLCAASVSSSAIKVSSLENVKEIARLRVD